jgi:hypothetical protein
VGTPMEFDTKPTRDLIQALGEKLDALRGHL